MAIDWSDLKWIADVGWASHGVGVRVPRPYTHGEVGPDEDKVGFFLSEDYKGMVFVGDRELSPKDARELAGYIVRAAKEAEYLEWSIHHGHKPMPSKNEVGHPAKRSK